MGRLQCTEDRHTFDEEDALRARLEGALKKARIMLRMSALATSDKMVERETLKEVIQENHRRWGSCLMLPVTVLFFVAFSLTVIFAEDVTHTYMMDAPIRDWLVTADPSMPGRKTLEQVTRLEDVYTFINTTYLPLFFRQTDTHGRPLPRSKWGTVFQYSQVVGDVVLEQIRTVKKPCRDLFPSFADGLAKDHFCYGSEEFSSETYGDSWEKLVADNGQSIQDLYLNSHNPLLRCENEGFMAAAPDGCNPSRRLAMLREEKRSLMPDGGSTFIFPTSRRDNFYTFVLDPTTAYEDVMLRLNYLQKRGWLDEQTAAVQLRALVINADLDQERIMETNVMFFYMRGGGVFTKIRLEVLLLGETNPTFSLFFFFTLFLAMLITTTGFLTASLIIAVRKGLGKEHFKDSVNIIMWFSAVLGWMNILAYVIQDLRLRPRVVAKLVHHLDTRTSESNTDLQDLVAKATFFTSYLRLLSSATHILFMLRILVSLKWQPRLAVVTATLTAALPDLAHFLLVFMPTFTAFAFSGLMMFGRHMLEFSTPVMSVMYAFKILIENEFDWKRLSETGFFTAFFWAACFFFLVVILMLNMLLAIIMDVYQEVRRHSGETMTLMAHSIYIYRRIMYRRVWIDDSDLLRSVSEMPQTISVNELYEAFPEIHVHQLKHLVRECHNKARAITRLGIHPSYSAQMVAAVQVSLQEMLRDVHELRSRGWMASGLEVGNDQDRIFVKDILSSVAVQTHWMDLTQKAIDRMDRLLTDKKAPKLMADRSSMQR